MKDQDLEFNFSLEEILNSPNLAEDIDDDALKSLGNALKRQVELDDSSRSEWLERNDKWMELVTQVLEEKSWPWPNASNIKFPLIATAAVQFHARAHPALLGNSRPVKAKIIGRDPAGLKAERAERVSTLMSYQVLEEIPDWQDEMDRLLFLVPIIGSLYKKTYYSPAKGKICSELINPRDFIINYDAIDIKDARKTHRLWKYPNKIKEMQRKGVYRMWEGDDNYQPTKTKSHTADEIQGKTNSGDEDDYALQELYEIHTLLDLDGDGYKEPYVITIRAWDGNIYRIIPNYGIEDIEYNQDREVAEITPKEYFTHYYFLPDPESKTHGIGFGTMIGPLNEAVNTILNQLTDAGTLSNLQGGFLSRGVRMKGGAMKFKPGEWKVINSTGDDLKKGIFPMPVKEPSNVLFQLLGLLIDSGKDLSSVQDIMVGRNPGQNQPYRTSIEVIEQGMKVFNGIYKRLYRSMTNEFKKIYALNRIYPDPWTYKNVLDLDGQETAEADAMFGPDKVLQFLMADFTADDINIVPSAEPDMIHETQKVLRANSLLEKLAGGLPINVLEVTKRALEAEGHEDVATLMDVPDPGPSFEQQIEIRKQEHQEKIDILKAQLEQAKIQSEISKNEFESMLMFAKAKNEDVNGLHAQFVQQQELQRKEFDSITQRIKALADVEKAKQAGKPAVRDSGEGK